MVDIRVVDRPNTRYREYVSSQVITMTRGPFIKPLDKVFMIGICFAREIRFALRDRGIAVSPQYAKAEFDPRQVRIDNLPRE